MNKFFRLLGSSSLHVNSPWVYKQVFPLIITGVFKLNKNGLYVPQLLWSLSFRLFETMVISNARNNPCPLSHNATFFFLPLYNHFGIHCIFKFCFTFLTDLFWYWRKGNKFTYSVNVPFLSFSDNHFRGFKFKKFFWNPRYYYFRILEIPVKISCQTEKLKIWISVVLILRSGILAKDCCSFLFQIVFHHCALLF